MKNLVLGIAFAVGLAGCDTVEDMRDILDTQEQMRGMIREDLGVLPLVGFNTRDGMLIDVSIALSASDVADRNVSELVRIARKAVRGSFEDEPHAIYIQIVTDLGE